jgi:protein-disulfide isomerase
MAGMKGFYMILGGVAIAGAGALWWSNSGAASLPDDPISSGAIDAERGWPGYVEGSADAPIELIEYADFQCPACRQFWVLTVQDVKNRLVPTGQVRYVFKDFPLDGPHAHARAAHHAAACASEQGSFLAMHDMLFNSQGEWGLQLGSPLGMFKGYAEEIGLDGEAYDACMGEGRYRARIQASLESGLERGVTSTPTLIIGGRLYTGMPYDRLKAIVDSLLAVETQ